MPPQGQPEQTLYQVLGVANNASADDIKKAYRKAALKYHPDKGSGNEDLFKRAVEANETLGDDKKRAEYDQTIGIGVARRPKTTFTRATPSFTSFRSPFSTGFTNFSFHDDDDDEFADPDPFASFFGGTSGFTSFMPGSFFAQGFQPTSGHTYYRETPRRRPPSNQFDFQARQSRERWQPRSHTYDDDDDDSDDDTESGRYDQSFGRQGRFSQRSRPSGSYQTYQSYRPDRTEQQARQSRQSSFRSQRQPRASFTQSQPQSQPQSQSRPFARSSQSRAAPQQQRPQQAQQAQKPPTQQPQKPQPHRAGTFARHFSEKSSWRDTMNSAYEANQHDQDEHKPAEKPEEKLEEKPEKKEPVVDLTGDDDVSVIDLSEESDEVPPKSRAGAVPQASADAAAAARIAATRAAALAAEQARARMNSRAGTEKTEPEPVSVHDNTMDSAAAAAAAAAAAEHEEASSSSSSSDFHMDSEFEPEDVEASPEYKSATESVDSGDSGESEKVNGRKHQPDEKPEPAHKRTKFDLNNINRVPPFTQTNGNFDMHDLGTSVPAGEDRRRQFNGTIPPAGLAGSTASGVKQPVNPGVYSRNHQSSISEYGQNLDKYMNDYIKYNQDMAGAVLKGTQSLQQNMPKAFDAEKMQEQCQAAQSDVEALEQWLSVAKQHAQTMKTWYKKAHGS